MNLCNRMVFNEGSPRCTTLWRSSKCTRKGLHLDEGLRGDVVSAHLQETQQPLHDAAHVLYLHIRNRTCSAWRAVARCKGVAQALGRHRWTSSQ